MKFILSVGAFDLTKNIIIVIKTIVSRNLQTINTTINTITCQHQNMSKQHLYKANLESHQAQCEDGQTQGKSNLLDCQTASTDCTITLNFLLSLESQKQKIFSKKQFVMQESPVIIKNKISNVKLNTSKNNIQTRKLSKTSDQGLTGTKKVFKPFWNESSKEQSGLLWSPTKIDCVDSDLSSFSGCSKNLIAKSWYSNQLQKPKQMTKIKKENSHKMSFLLSTILQQKITECEQPKTKDALKKKKKKKKKEKKKRKRKGKKKKRDPHRQSKKTKYGGPFRVKKIRLYPTAMEKIKLNKWFGAARWTYNKCLEFQKSEYEKGNKNPTDAQFRKKFIENKIIGKNQELKWLLDIPYNVRDDGMRDLKKNVASNIQKITNGTIKHFNLKFRKARRESQSITIRPQNYNRDLNGKKKRKEKDDGAFVFIKRMKKKEALQPQQVKHEIKIKKDVYGDYWICVPTATKMRSDNQTSIFSKSYTDGVIALDPGVRTFLTGFDSYNKQAIHLGNDVCKRIDKNHKEQDILTSKIKRRKGNKMRLVYAIRRKRKQLKNMMKDLHYKVGTFLCTNYKTILLPTFGTQDMINKEKRKIGSNDARRLQSHSHYTFQQRLIQISKKYKNCNVILVDEDYTSVTCSECGWYNRNLKGSKTFKCERKGCKKIFDRDVNAAKNIFLKNNEYKRNNKSQKMRNKKVMISG